ncbi:MAG: LysM peptidoglycan-binding domain-containing protein [Desulfobacterales bacterium]
MTFKQDDAEETYEDYDAYAALNRQGFLRKPFVPYIAAGVVALAVILGFSLFGARYQNDELSEKIALLDKHLADIEFRLGNLEQANAGAESTPRLREMVETQAKQFQALESKLGQNLNQINSKLAALEKNQQRSAPTTASPPPARKAKAASAKVHVVKAGETLYQISRKYDLTVDELKKLNNMGNTVTIRPGQKLVVGNR